jgi:hypothetical protein
MAIRCIMQRRVLTKHKYFCEIETKFENILVDQSGTKMGSIDEKS